MPTKNRVFEGIYEVGVYPTKRGKKGTQLFAYLIPQNPFKKRKIVKLSNLKEVEIRENGEVKERYTGLLPARTVRMVNGKCEYNDGMLICDTDRIVYMKKRSGGR